MKRPHGSALAVLMAAVVALSGSAHAGEAPPKAPAKAPPDAAKPADQERG